MSNYWRAKRVLVAGGAGFIGSALANELARRGAVVTAAVRDPDSRLANLDRSQPIRIVYADFTQLEQCVQVTLGQDHVILAAGIDGNAQFKRQRAAFIFRTNSLITLNLLEASRLNAVGRVTYISSAEVYAATMAARLSEDLPLGDASLPTFTSYALAKLVGEMAARMYYQEHGLAVAIARPCNVYGPGDGFDDKRGRVIPLWIKAGIEGSPIRIWGTGHEVRSFVFIDDLVDGLLSLSEVVSSATPVNLAGPKETTLFALAELIKKVGSFDSAIETVASESAGPLKRILDIRRARQTLKYRPSIELAQGLEMTIRYARARLNSYQHPLIATSI